MENKGGNKQLMTSLPSISSPSPSLSSSLFPSSSSSSPYSLPSKPKFPSLLSSSLLPSCAPSLMMINATVKNDTEEEPSTMIMKIDYTLALDLVLPFTLSLCHLFSPSPSSSSSPFISFVPPKHSDNNNINNDNNDDMIIKDNNGKGDTEQSERSSPERIETGEGKVGEDHTTTTTTTTTTTPTSTTGILQTCMDI